MTTITGIIYKITDNTNDNVYYGSTIRKLSERKAEHKYQYKQYCEGKRGFTTAYDILKNNDWKIELVEECTDDLVKRERWYIENNECLNKRVEGRNLQEYYIQVLKPARQEFYFCETCQKNVKNHLQKSHEKSKLHLGIPKNKRPLLLNPKDKILCECGIEYTRNHKQRHMNTQQHKDLII